MADYSGRALWQKIGFKPGYQFMVINKPLDYDALVAGMSAECKEVQDGESLDLIHFFADSEEELRVLLPAFRRKIKSNGMIWVSWPKKASGVDTDLSGDVVRRCGLGLDLVDVKVCAVDETWSGLKFVIPKSMRVENQK
ncbi:MAG: DUF3052 domain-containing protein [Rhodothermales bacterium]|nr:DUF3052 domain-containing protein [Rhodothermales bacterium]